MRVILLPSPLKEIMFLDQDIYLPLNRVANYLVAASNQLPSENIFVLTFIKLANKSKFHLPIRHEL